MSYIKLKEQKINILLVDDEPRVCSLYQNYLSDEFNVETATHTKEALQKLSKKYFDLVLLDIGLPGESGISALTKIKAAYPSTDVIMFTMSSSVEHVVTSMKEGAIDYIEKHKPRELVRLAIHQALEKRSLNQNVSYYKSKEENLSSIYKKLIGKSQRIRDIIELLKKLNNKDVGILITGENGTGKEIIAQLLTKQEDNGKRLQYSLNCGAVSSNLIESELFGHVKGAFTDARGDRKGIFEQAHGHDVFLDEIGELPLELQPKLLRVLQEKEIKRVGSNETIKVDFRLIASTNRDLKKMVEKGTFREDLYYRLNVINIQTPTLRERQEDIPLLARYILDTNGYVKKEIPEETMEILLKYQWPGNVRQLKNTLISMAIHSDSEHILRKKWIPTEILLDQTTFLNHKKTLTTQFNLGEVLEEVEKKLTFEALEKTNWIVVKAAKLLGTHRNSVNKKLKIWDWKRPLSH